MKFSHDAYPSLPTFLERLNHAFNNQPLKQGSIAKAAGMSQASLNDLLTGKSKTSKYLKEIAAALEVDYQWLTTGVVSEDTSDALAVTDVPLLETFDEYINVNNSPNKKAPPKSVQLDSKALRNRDIDLDDARYIPMTDKGMGVLINEDSPVFFNTQHKFIEDGMTYVISHGGMLQVRQLYQGPFGSVKIQPLNSQFESTTLDLDQQSTQLFSILGQVFAVVNYY